MKENLIKNEKINLTAITNEKEFWIKHILDSLSCIDSIEFKESYSIVDIGTGAGFPGIPLAILFPEKEFVLVDSLRKRLNVIKEVTDKLEIKNVKILHARAEDIGKNEIYREKFDLCVSRAVASLDVLAEWCMPLVKKGGTFISYKGEKAGEEIKTAKNAIKILGGKVNRIEKPEFMHQDTSEHVLIYISKVRNTPRRFPRKAGEAKKNPIT